MVTYSFLGVPKLKTGEVLELAGKNDDEGTDALFSDLISSTEKNLWMLKSTLA